MNPAPFHRLLRLGTLAAGLGASAAMPVRAQPDDEARCWVAIRINGPEAMRVSEEEAEASFAAQVPIGRIVEPSDIAPMVLVLASPHASAITGQSIAIDGGSTPGTYY